MNIFVGDLSFETTEVELKQLFETIGEVSSVVIVMEKEKRAPKSRGFGFVEMPVEAQALAAISALNGKDFMGRLLDVNPTRPKTETQRQSELEKRTLFKAKAKTRMQDSRYQNESREEKEVSARPFISKPGAYKGGRRTRSYALRTGVVDMEKGTKPWQRRQENPMRWRNRQDQPRPWQKDRSERKPWEKPEGAPQEAKPWKKPVGSSKPWQKSTSVRKPWEKPEGGVSQESKPWKKPGGNSKPWVKRGERPHGSSFKARGKSAKIIVDKG